MNTRLKEREMPGCTTRRDYATEEETMSLRKGIGIALLTLGNLVILLGTGISCTSQEETAGLSVKNWG